MLLVFDTEGTGLPKKDVPLDHKSQPFIIQIGAICYNNAEERRIVGTLDVILRPYSLYTSIEPGAQAVHGISMEEAEAYGVHPRAPLMVLGSMMQKAEVIVAQNMEHELRMLLRHMDALEVKLDLCRQKHFCTMRTFSERFRIPGAKWNKWPRLEEMHQFLLGMGFDGAHNALVDAEATARCYFAMIERLEQVDVI